MKKLKKNWKKITLGIVGIFAGLVVLFGVGIFLWMQTWKTFNFPDSSLTFKYPQGGNLVYQGPDGYNEYIIKYKLFYLSIDHYDCSRNVIDKNLDSETCGEKSVDNSTEINASDTHPFLENIPKNYINISGHRVRLLTLGTQTDVNSNEIVSNTTVVFNDKREVYFLNFGNYFSNKNIILKYISQFIFNKIINSIKFH